MEKGMEKEKNIILMVNQNLKEIIYIVKDGMENDIAKKVQLVLK